MKNINWKQFAPYGLYLSGLALLVAAGLFIIQREWNLYLQISLAVALLGLALAVLLDPDSARRALTGRQARYGSNALVLSLAFVGIVVVINYLGYQNSQRWDLTEDKQNTLATETLDTLNQLEEPVEAVGFFTARTNSETARALLDQYKFNSNGSFDYRFVDPEADPLAAQAANITRDGTVVLSKGERQEAVTIVTEQELTGALVRLISGQTPALYFLTGHGELDPDGTGDQAYSDVKRTLESKNYIANKLNLLATNTIPEDARVIIIAGPTVPLSEAEVSSLSAYVAQGKALIVLYEPLPLTEFGDQPDPLSDYLAATYGISLGRDLVVDLTSQQPFVAWAFQYAEHPITTKMQGLGAYFPTVRSVQATGATQGATATELVLTADQTWAETDLVALTDQSGQQQVQPDEGVDIIGQVPVAVVAEGSLSGERVVVFGDAEFAANANFNSFGNGDLLVNTVDWATEQEELINLTPREQTQRTLVQPQRYTMNLIFFGSVVFLPGLVLFAGVIVFFQRRRRG